MVHLPKVVGLVLCDRLGVLPDTRQVSLIGLFHARHFRNFPSLPQEFTVYAALYEGAGEGTIELRLTRLETEEDFYSYKKWITYPEERGKVVNLEVPVKNCVFQAPGRYRLTLLFDNQELTHRFLEIYRVEKT